MSHTNGASAPSFWSSAIKILLGVSLGAEDYHGCVECLEINRPTNQLLPRRFGCCKTESPVNCGA